MCDSLAAASPIHLAGWRGKARREVTVMKPVSMTHIAICVLPAELRQAEEFYRRAFQMKVAFRETMTSDGWATLPDEDAWDYAARSGIDIGLVMLFRDQFAIDLEARAFPTGGGRFSHVGLEVDDRELIEVRERCRAAGCRFTFESDDIVVFNDPYGMRWEYTTLPYADPYGLSAGRRNGHWHRAKQPVLAGV
jgi:catechol 2,3-dioxygenase-like lactoylglutathione lyase family enzyme